MFNTVPRWRCQRFPRPFPADDAYKSDWAFQQLSEEMAENRRLALENNLIVVTRNVRDFNRVPGVQTEDWSV
jgi:hypothetical protein